MNTDMLTRKFGNKSIKKQKNYHNIYKMIYINTLYHNIIHIYITGNKICGAKLHIKTYFKCKCKFKLCFKMKEFKATIVSKKCIFL